MENKKRILIVGDIHGNHKGLKQALERSNFDYENDTLISLGDVIDGHSESYEVVEELLKIKNLIAIKGNHDDWFNTWLETGDNPSLWMQGQQATGESYIKQFSPDNHHLWDYSTGIARCRLTTAHIKDSHINFFKNQLLYYIDENNNLFIHGGFDRHEKLEEQAESNFYWDRDLWKQALSFEATKRGNTIPNYEPSFVMVEEFNHIFIGHTSTQFWDSNIPMTAANITNLDTGGGWHGYITIMDLESREYWQSDDAKSLYPDFKGR
jgi:serine/threonine protein phosphatase 1